MTARLPRFVAAAGLACVLLGACAGGGAETPNAAAVTVKSFAFQPKTIRVRVGGTVTWTNKDSFDHSVQIDSLHVAGPKFGPQSSQTTFSHRFTTAGTYPYICGVHNSMTGTVIVTS
ncbi:MAG TPA: cupredoxin domain-containing protein [Acidimicrobiales bacterium]|nr:cupredoxin domain-containing protein [Acidimicrobiales bacterium]